MTHLPQTRFALPQEAWDAPRQQQKDAMPDLEELRLRALHECRSLDTAAEARFNTITKLVQGIFKASRHDPCPERGEGARRR